MTFTPRHPLLCVLSLRGTHYVDSEKISEIIGH